MLLSIIIPAYKVEKYLERCLDSITSQVNDNIEIIVVDDGSPDSSGEIAERYQKNYSNLIVIHKENGGLSDARNKGFEVANGQYVMFVDSDDYMVEGCISKICEILNNNYSDVIVGNANFEYETGVTIERKFSSDIMVSTLGETFMFNELSRNTMMMAVWLYIYRSDFLRENGLFFKKGILHEDEEFTPRVLLKAKNVMYTGITHYNYFIRENSITTTSKKEKNTLDLFETLMELEKYYDSITNKKHKKVLKNSLVTKYLYTWVNNDLSTKKGWKKNRSFLVRNAYGIKNAIKVRLFLLNEKLYKRIAKGINNG